jgi:hypothetical protein
VVERQLSEEPTLPSKAPPRPAEDTLPRGMSLFEDTLRSGPPDVDVCTVARSLEAGTLVELYPEASDPTVVDVPPVPTPAPTRRLRAPGPTIRRPLNLSAQLFEDPTEIKHDALFEELGTDLWRRDDSGRLMALLERQDPDEDDLVPPPPLVAFGLHRPAWRRVVVIGGSFLAVLGLAIALYAAIVHW